MAAVSIPPIPTKTPVIDPKTGLMTQVWVQWFNTLQVNIKDLIERVEALEA